MYSTCILHTFHIFHVSKCLLIYLVNLRTGIRAYHSAYSDNWQIGRISMTSLMTSLHVTLATYDDVIYSIQKFTQLPLCWYITHDTFDFRSVHYFWSLLGHIFWDTLYMESYASFAQKHDIPAA